MRVEAPNKAYVGTVGRDAFVNGICEDASPEQEAYYRRKGYRIIGDVEKQSATGETPDTPDVVDRSTWKKADWLHLAQSLELDVDSGDTVAEIKAAVAAHEATDDDPADDE